MRPPLLLVLSLLLTVFQAVALAVPRLLSHQGRVAVNGVSFDGPGQFKFALTDAGAATTHWSNDGTGTGAPGGEPASAVTLTVTRGLYSVLLGDTTVPNMTAVPSSVFENDTVFLRVWFNDGNHGFQRLAPDQRLAAVGYALVAERAGQVLLRDVMAPLGYHVTAWGDDRKSQSKVPATLSDADVMSVAGGEEFSLALLKNGTVTAWGDNAFEQLNVPTGLSSVRAVAAGAFHALALKADGTVAAWGSAANNSTAVPVGLTGVSAIAAGENHSLALKSDGTVIAWGDNSFGQLNVPAGLSGVRAIAAGSGHCLALKNDGTVTAWGRSFEGQLAIPAGLNGVQSIAAGAHHGLALKNDGTVTAWGLDDGKQSTVPPTLDDAVSIAAGRAFSLALRGDGTVVIWGDNSYKQKDPPAGLSGITAISAGTNHILAICSVTLVPAAPARLDQSNIFTGNVGIRRAAAKNPLEVEGDASKLSAGNWSANSDRRIKEDIRSVTNALDTLGKVRLVDFRYTPEYLSSHPALENRRYLNVIAQEFAEVFPGHVHGSGERLPDGSEILQVDT